MEWITGSGHALSAGQAAFAAEVGAGSCDVLASAVEGRVFVYVQEARRTIRYELDPHGFVMHGDVFARDPSRQPLASQRVSTGNGRSL